MDAVVGEEEQHAVQGRHAVDVGAGGPGVDVLDERRPGRRTVRLPELLAVDAVVGEEEGRGTDGREVVGLDPTPERVHVRERGAGSATSSVRLSRASNRGGKSRWRRAVFGRRRDEPARWSTWEREFIGEILLVVVERLMGLRFERDVGLRSPSPREINGLGVGTVQIG